MPVTMDAYEGAWIRAQSIREGLVGLFRQTRYGRFICLVFQSPAVVSFRRTYSYEAKDRWKKTGHIPD